jgi:hypothetical protein
VTAILAEKNGMRNEKSQELLIFLANGFKDRTNYV